jgi:A/G-specific adenine glycosylase
MNESGFAQRLVAWQRDFGRNQLPWSGQDAYSVWLSEVMLQQTQVATVLPYYSAFKAQFPTVQSLAAAPLEAVLALWAGLGYYSRARNLHRCAQQVCEQYDAHFPDDLNALQALPGIGPSTAAAIASLAYQQRAAILDGNVKRVLARHAGIAGWAGHQAVTKVLWAQAQARLVPEHCAVPSDHHRRYTQGLMDLGATLCTAKAPQCHRCPVRSDCQAYADQTTMSIPAPRPKKTVPSQQRCALVLHTSAGVWLERRPNKGLWGGLLCLPEALDYAACAALANQLGARQSTKHAQNHATNHAGSEGHLTLLPWHRHTLKHSFTHYTLHWQLWSCEPPAEFWLPKPWVFCPWADVGTIGVPKAVLKVLA